MLLRRVAVQRGIQSIPSVDEFIALIVEVIEDNNIEIKKQILAAYNNKEEAANSKDGNKKLVVKVTFK